MPRSCQTQHDSAVGGVVAIFNCRFKKKKEKKGKLEHNRTETSALRFFFFIPSLWIELVFAMPSPWIEPVLLLRVEIPFKSA